MGYIKKAFVLEQIDVDTIENKRPDMGNCSASAALRSIIKEHRDLGEKEGKDNE